jgi:GntR family transcriptional regulator, arabinose operon transcriptional repressor
MKRYKYETVIEYITDKYIDNPALIVGKLPSEPELAKEMKISRYPVNQAYNILVEQGKLTKISGVGTFVSGQEPKNYLFKRTVNRSAGLICGTGCLAPQLQAGLHDELLQHGITLTNILTDEPYSEENTLARVRELKLQCIFVISRLFFGTGENPTIKFIKKVAGLGVLPIVIERPLKGYNGIQVLVDNAGGTAMAAEWLLNDGHKKIAYIGKDDYVVGHERFNGYLNTLRNNGIEPDKSLISLDRSNGQFEHVWEKFVEDSMDKMMKQHSDCRSFVAFSVEIAYRIYLYLKKHGQFFADTKIAGYESLPHFNDEFRDCYICLERPLYKIGREAGALMSEFISENKQDKYVIKRILPEMHFCKKSNFINTL